MAEGDREGDIMGKKVPGCELYVTTVYKIYIPIYNWWWFQPLSKIWVRQLGWWHSQYMENKIHVPNHHFVLTAYPGYDTTYIFHKLTISKRCFFTICISQSSHQWKHRWSHPYVVSLPSTMFSGVLNVRGDCHGLYQGSEYEPLLTTSIQHFDYVLEIPYNDF